MPGNRRGNYLAVWILNGWLFCSSFCFRRYCFPFGRPEGALKATLSLLERVCLNIALWILLALSNAVCFSYWNRQTVSFFSVFSLVPHTTSISHLFLLQSNSPYIFSLLKPFKTYNCHHMVSWWHIFGSNCFSFSPPPLHSLLFLHLSIIICFSDFTVVFYYLPWFICTSTCHIPCTYKNLSFNIHTHVISFTLDSSQMYFKSICYYKWIHEL